MIVFVTFLWPKQRSQMALPAVPTPYGAQHVNILRNMIWRNYHLPHRFILLTSEHVPGHTHQNLLSLGLDPRIEVYPIYPKPSNEDEHFATYQDPACPFSPFNHPLEGLAGCFKRLVLHTDQCADRLNLSDEDFVVQIDLDCIILDDITSLFNPGDLLSLPEGNIPFRMNNYNAPIYSEPRPGQRAGRYPQQEYNGALQFFKPRDPVLRNLHDELLRHPDPWAHIRAATERREVIGSDQAWITLFMREHGLAPPKFTNTDGVYEFRQFKPASLSLNLLELWSASSPNDLVHSYYKTPAGQPKIIFFAGPSDPSITRDSVPWVREAWR